MGVDVSAYVERKNKDTGKWELVTENAVSTRLKYVIEDYNELPRMKWEDLSEGMQAKFKKDENGNVFCNFHVTTLDDLEKSVSSRAHDVFSRMNTIVKALGVDRIYSDDGDEIDCYGEDTKEKLTFPVSKSLIEDLQVGCNEIRKVGQQEAFDLLVSEYVSYDAECRIILVVC